MNRKETTKRLVDEIDAKIKVLSESIIVNRRAYDAQIARAVVIE